MTLQLAEIQSIIDSIDVLSIIFRYDRIQLANRSALKWAGLDAVELKNQKLLQWIHPQSREFAILTYRQIVRGELLQRSFTICLIHPIRGSVWVRASVKAAPYLADDCWIVSFSELNAAVKAKLVDGGQQNISDYSHDIVALNPTLSEIIAEHRFRNDMLEQFLQTLEELIPFDSASIALIRNDMLEFVAVRGKLEELELSKLTHELNIVKTAKPLTYMLEAEHGRVQIIPDTHQEPTWIPVEGTDYIRSWMGVLLYFNQEVIGLLNMEHSQPNYFTEEQADIALSLSRQATQAIVYTRMYLQAELDIQERERLQEILVRNLVSTETMYATQQILASTLSLHEVLPEITGIIASSMHDTKIFLVAFDEAEKKLIHCVQLSDTDEDIWAIYKQIIKQPRLPEHIMPVDELVKIGHRIHSLDDGRQAIAGLVNQRGLLFAIRPENAPAFTDIEQELLMNVASLISVAIDNELLDAQLKQHTQQLERLVEQRTFQLGMEQKRLQAILDATAEGIFYMENFLFQYTNPAFCRMVGYSFDELYGKPLSFMRMISEEEEPHNFNTLLDNPINLDSGRSETRLQHRNGTEFYAKIRYSLLGKPNENPIRMVAVARDISQERKLYIQRARFIANAAHELRTPLSSLVLRLHMLRRQPERMDDHLDSLDQVTVYLRELVEQLLDLSRFERGTINLERGNFVLQELIRQAVAEHAPFAEEQHVKVEVDLPEKPVEIRADGTRIVQMVSNLVANGINYNHVGGLVQVNMRVEKDVVGNQNAIIEIMDTGIGIEDDLLPDEVFEPFSRPSAGNRKETGMGLALVREIAVLHEGTVHVRSKLDEGSTFRVSLPLD